MSRVNLSKRLLSILERESQNNYNFIITGDESWFYLSTDHTTQWVPAGEEPSTRERKMIGSKKFMITIFWNPSGFHLIKILPEDAKFNGKYFIDEILDPIYEITTPLREEFGRNIILHYDNARPHTSRKVTDYLESHDIEKAPHPPFSPDIAPSDFYLFGYIKQKIAGRHFEDPEDLYSAVDDIFSEIPKGELMSVFETWKTRLKTVITSNGDYVG